MTVTIKKELDPERETKRKEIVEATDMVIKLCLIAGTRLSTAYQVGALFAGGLEKEILNERQSEDKRRIS
jgi:hypothetical protein